MRKLLLWTGRILSVSVLGFGSWFGIALACAYFEVAPWLTAMIASIGTIWAMGEFVATVTDLVEGQS